MHIVTTKAAIVSTELFLLFFVVDSLQFQCYNDRQHLEFGGTRNLRGCDPKKVLVGAAEVIDWNHRMGDKGINNTKDIHIKWPELMRFSDP